jgi:hypothetical protein
VLLHIQRDSGVQVPCSVAWLSSALDCICKCLVVKQQAVLLSVSRADSVLLSVCYTLFHYISLQQLPSGAPLPLLFNFTELELGVNPHLVDIIPDHIKASSSSATSTTAAAASSSQSATKTNSFSTSNSSSSSSQQQQQRSSITSTDA